MLFALLATVSMMLGLLRWPSIHWVLAEAYARVGTSVAGLIGMFRNVTVVGASIAALNNYLLPLWMVTFGVGLLRVSGSHGALPERR